jgi:hypothetical protein
LSVDAFISQFGGLTEAYYFYNGEVELHYDPKQHLYLLAKDGDLIPQEGVTNVCHIIDKSEALIPWATKQMAGMLLHEAAVVMPDGQKLLRGMGWQEFENLVLASKTAHRDKLEEAGDIGHIAHAWIERYIKAVLYYGTDSIQVQEVLAKFPDNEKSMNCCLAALDWMRNHNVRWLGTERKIFSREYGYAGTMDGLCMVDSCSNHHCCKFQFKDRLTISDWKTSNYLYIEYLLQTAAYMSAYNEEERYTKGDNAKLATDRWIIRLGKEEGDLQTWHAPREDYLPDFQGFALALKLKRQVYALNKRVKDRDAATRASIRAERKAAKEAAELEAKQQRAAEKEQARLERAAALKIKCAKADNYKGVRAPTCGCETCAAKYAEVQANKPVPKGKKVTKKHILMIEKKVAAPQLCLPVMKPQLLLPAPGTDLASVIGYEMMGNLRRNVFAFKEHRSALTSMFYQTPSRL